MSEDAMERPDPITALLAAAKAEGIAIGEERMRERAAQRCTTVETREPFGSEGYDAAIRMGEELSKIIRALPVTAEPDESGTEGGRTRAGADDGA